MRHPTWTTRSLVLVAVAASAAGAQDIDTGAPP